MREVLGLTDGDADRVSQFNELAAGELGLSVDDILPIIKPFIRGVIANPQISGYLRDLGRFVVRKAVKLITEPAPPAPRVVTEIILPLLDPFIEGVKEEVIEQIKPVAIGLGVGAVVTHGLAFFIGRGTKRCG